MGKSSQPQGRVETPWKSLEHFPTLGLAKGWCFNSPLLIHKWYIYQSLMICFIWGGGMDISRLTTAQFGVGLGAIGTEGPVWSTSDTAKVPAPIRFTARTWYLASWWEIQTWSVDGREIMMIWFNTPGASHATSMWWSCSKRRAKRQRPLNLGFNSSWRKSKYL